MNAAENADNHRDNRSRTESVADSDYENDKD